MSGQGIYRDSVANGWQQLIGVVPSLTAVNASGDLAVEFAGYGVFILKHGTGSPTQLTPANAALLTIDNNGDVFADLQQAGVKDFP